MSRFNEIMEIVFKWEGKYFDHPDDPGGATNFGITHEVLAEWRGVTAVSKQEVKTMKISEARDIFETKYFKKIRGAELPTPIDLIMMDGAVNHGVTNMVRMFEKALGLAENGRMSVNDVKSTMTDIQNNSEAGYDLAIKLAEARKERYVTRPHAQSFIAGWTNRLNDVMAVALADAPIKWTFADGSDADSDGERATRMEPDPISSVVRPVIEDEDLQAALMTWGDYSGAIDGIFGQKSIAACNQALSRHNSKISGNWRAWSASRKKIAIGQLVCLDMEIRVGRIDGLVGPLTEAAFIAFNRKRLNLPDDLWRDELEEGEIPSWSPHVPASSPWPKESEIESFYGKQCVENGVKLVRLNTPFKLKLAWALNTEIDGFSINEHVHDSAARAFEKFYAEYGDDGIDDLGLNLFGGCYNCRPIRGGSRWSTHSWGIAIDFDPTRNKLRWDHKQARLAKPDAAKFWEIWESEGWLSLGRARNYDWMHVQAAIR